MRCHCVPSSRGFPASYPSLLMPIKVARPMLGPRHVVIQNLVGLKIEKKTGWVCTQVAKS